MNTEYVIEKINAALAQKTELHKASHAFADHHDEVTTGLVALDICRWHENARTLTAAGRAELQKEEAEQAEILSLAGVLGHVEKNGDGDGDGYAMKCFLIHPKS